MKTISCLRLEAHAKINWCLSVTGRTENGYHLLDMLMQRVSLYDTLFAAPSDHLTLYVIGQEVAGPEEDNLVLKAARALQAYRPQAGARLTLVKRIPQGAGMGGGSSDAAAALKLLNRLWALQLSPAELSAIALKLGADVPFFLKGRPARIRDIGEQLSPVSLPAGVPLVLVKATEGLNTGRVYGRSDALPAAPVDVDCLLPLLSAGDLKAAAPVTGNSLYPAAVSLCPKLEQIKNAVHASGASYVLMTGSGAVVYGAYGTSAQAAEAEKQLKAVFPDAFVSRAETVS